MVQMAANSPRTAQSLAEGRPFPEAATVVLRDMQNAFAGLIASIPYNHDGVRKAADLHKALQLDRKLAWQFYKIATADNPLSVGSSVPKKVSLARLFKAATDRNVPEHVVDRAAAAFDQFEKFVAGHAGDREVFGSMISSLESTSADQLDLAHKKASFKAASHFLGVQAKTMLQCWMMLPGEQPNTHDVASVRGMFGLKRLRADVPWVISRLRTDHTDGQVMNSLKHEPLDPGGLGPHGITLLKDFCSQPLPEFRTRKSPFGTIEVELVGEKVGRASLVTCLTGEVTRCGLPTHRIEDHTVHSTCAQVRTPCEVLIHDFIVFEDLFGPIKPRLAVGSDHRDTHSHLHLRPNDVLPVRESLRYLGRGPDCLHSADVPRYAEMFRTVTARLGWDADRFDVYRCRIEYPLMPSSVMIEIDLSE